MNVKEALHQLVDLLTLHPSASSQAHDLVEQIDGSDSKATAGADKKTEATKQT